MLEDAEGNETAGLLEQINTYSAIVHADDPINPWLDYLTGYAYASSGRKGDAIVRLETFVGTREGRNYWRAHRLEMINHQTGKSTVLEFADYEFQVNVGKSQFSAGRLKRVR